MQNNVFWPVLICDPLYTCKFGANIGPKSIVGLFEFNVLAAVPETIKQMRLFMREYGMQTCGLIYIPYALMNNHICLTFAYNVVIRNYKKISGDGKKLQKMYFI